ncbi:MAG: chromate transporter [Mycobacterium leprae]
MTLWTIFITMVQAGLSAVGGGWGTIAAAQSAWVHPGMLTPEQFAWAVSVGQITPGPFSVLVVALGYQLRHVAGAVVALAGILLPTWVVCVIAGRGLKRYQQALAPFAGSVPWILAAMAAASGIRMVLPMGVHPVELLVGVGAFLAVAWKRIEPVWVLAAAAAIGGVLVMGHWA